MINLEKFKAILMERRSEVQQLDKGAAASREAVQLDQSSVGRLSRIDAMQGQAMAMAAQRRRLAEVNRIEAALRRIADGEYGMCDECGEDIPERRLEIDPVATLCVRCAGRI